MGLISENERNALIENSRVLDNLDKLTDEEFLKLPEINAKIRGLFYNKIKHVLEDKEIRVKFNLSGHHTEN